MWRHGAEENSETGVGLGGAGVRVGGFLLLSWNAASKVSAAVWKSGKTEGIVRRETNVPHSQSFLPPPTTPPRPPPPFLTVDDCCWGQWRGFVGGRRGEGGGVRGRAVGVMRGEEGHKEKMKNKTKKKAEKK